MGENKVNIIPKPKKLEKREGFLQKKEVKLVSEVGDERILMAISSFKLADDGMPLVISVGDDGKEYRVMGKSLIYNYRYKCESEFLSQIGIIHPNLIWKDSRTEPYRVDCLCRYCFSHRRIELLMV